MLLINRHIDFIPQVNENNVFSLIIFFLKFKRQRNAQNVKRVSVLLSRICKQHFGGKTVYDGGKCFLVTRFIWYLH